MSPPNTLPNRQHRWLEGTQAAWKMLFTKVVILLCILHCWLKIRDRPNTLKSVCRISRVFGYRSGPDLPEFLDNACGRSAVRPDTSQDRPGEGLGPVWQA